MLHSWETEVECELIRSLGAGRKCSLLTFRSKSEIVSVCVCVGVDLFEGSLGKSSMRKEEG